MADSAEVTELKRQLTIARYDCRFLQERFKLGPAERKLGPAEYERLAYLAEECAEVIKCVTKILRHGFDCYNPHAYNDGDNREQLCAELGDVQSAVARLVDAHDLDQETIDIYAGMARKKSQQWMHYQEQKDD